MMNVSDSTSTQPYLIRALYEWCTDNGYTPYVSVSVDDSVQVPREYVKDGEIVLNISFDATSSLKLGNDFIEFKGRFAGTARDISVPIGRVLAIYARENGQGMAFILNPSSAGKSVSKLLNSQTSVQDSVQTEAEPKIVQLAMVESERRSEDPDKEPDPPRLAPNGQRPVLKRVK